MRRPNLCNNSVTVADDSYKPQSTSKDEDVRRLSLMRRVLGGGGGGGHSKKRGHHKHPQTAAVPQTGSGGGGGSRLFGVSLHQLKLRADSVPCVLHSICIFIEMHGLGVEGLWRGGGGGGSCPAAGGGGSLDQLRATLEERDGQLEVEVEEVTPGTTSSTTTSAGGGVEGKVRSFACLLLLWLGELPEPLLSHQLTSDLVNITKKYSDDDDNEEDEMRELWERLTDESEVAAVVRASLWRLLTTLHSYWTAQSAAVGYLPQVFAPLLAPPYFGSLSVGLLSTLIPRYPRIFKQTSIQMEVEGGGEPAEEDGEENRKCQEVELTRPPEVDLPEQPAATVPQRKRKERQDSTSLDHERKFVRSNSEERPTGESSGEKDSPPGDSIRRVSSHEDFSKAKTKSSDIQKPLGGSTALRGGTSGGILLPLHERNSRSPLRDGGGGGGGGSLQLNTSVGYTSELYDDSEHERRRHSERFAPQRRHKHYRTSSRAAKENKSGVKMKISSQYQNKAKSIMNETTPPNDLTNDSKVLSDDMKNNSSPEEERSPSPISGVSSPTLDMKTLQGVSNEPLTAWSTMLPPSEERLVSPRNSIVMSKRTFTSTLQRHDASFLDLTLQINALKQKLKKYDEGFEKEFGFKPSYEDKMANPDTKRMCSMLNKLKKQLKSAKEENSTKLLSETSRPIIKEEVVREIEKKLKEKRLLGGRGECIDEMSREEVVEEKGAMQKALLGLEAAYGRPQSKEERELVRGLYERYRTLKRALLRHAPSKVKESVSELGTIHEHEAMTFTAGAVASGGGSSSGVAGGLDRALSPSGQQPPLLRPDSPPPLPSAAAPPHHPSSSSPPPSESLLAHLHALPPGELVELSRATREEKRRLRWTLRQYEAEFEERTGRKPTRQESVALDSLYTDYKNTKAKLRFIQALVTKIK